MSGRIHMFYVVNIIFCLCVSLAICIQVKKFPLLMPFVHPDRDEFYLCTPFKLVQNESFYIVGFEPNATMERVHHIMIFGCSVPGTNDEYWNCGEMAASDDSGLKKAAPCRENSHVLFAWARDAKKLALPEDVGFQVGLGTQIQYIVLQIHYSKKYPDGVYDNSGIYLLYTKERQNKLAGVVLLGTGGTVKAMNTTHMETACMLSEKKTIFPFTYRTHTHNLGRVVSGYRVRRDGEGKDHWMLLGKRDPLTPQMFYPVFSREPITYGDRLAARCTMVSNRSRDTHVGPTNNDEMCNFYLMYYVKDGSPLDMKYCLKEGPPHYYWEHNDFNNIPSIEASTL